MTGEDQTHNLLVILKRRRKGEKKKIKKIVEEGRDTEETEEKVNASGDTEEMETRLLTPQDASIKSPYHTTATDLL